MVVHKFVNILDFFQKQLIEVKFPDFLRLLMGIGVIVVITSPLFYKRVNFTITYPVWYLLGSFLNLYIK